MKYRFTLTGEMPLLMHADIVEQADALAAWRKAPENKKLSVAGDDRSPGWTWMTYLYHDGERVSMPQENVMVALRNAGAKMTFKKQETFKKISQSGLLILDDHCEFLAAGRPVAIADVEKLRPLPFADQAQGAKALGLSLFIKRAKVGESKHVRVRPRFDEWSAAGTIEVLEPVITAEVLRQMFEIAGVQSGLGDWRPSSPKSPGPFGRFTAEVKPAK